MASPGTKMMRLVRSSLFPHCRGAFGGLELRLGMRLRYAAVAADDGGEAAKKEAMAVQMVEYATSFRKQGDAGYLDAMQVLEHGMSFMKDSGDSAANALCKIQLAIANFHVDRGKLPDAAEVLQSVASNTSASLEVRVSALEALTGVYLQLYQDDLAAIQAEAALKLVSSGENMSNFQARSEALAGLVKLAEAQFGAAASCFGKIAPGVDSTSAQGAATLARAEFTHLRGNDIEAKDLYNNAMKFAKEETEKNRGLIAVTMTPEEVQTAALAGLGQLSADLGRFADAEKNLTEALHVAESISGENHSRVGLVLSCMADLYTRRAKAENSGFMIAEGLYRRSLDLLKASSLEKESKDAFQYVDVIALTRARYADILSSVKQRESEASKLMAWAAAAWRNQRSLADIVKAGSTKEGPKCHAVIDVRLGRVF